MTDPAAARKRRKEIMQTLRAENAKKEESSAPSPTDATELPPPPQPQVEEEEEAGEASPPPPEEVLPPKKRKVTTSSSSSSNKRSKKQQQQQQQQHHDIDDDDEDEDHQHQQVVIQEVFEEGVLGCGAAKVTTVMTADGSKKMQIRYDPETPMEKDQLAAWRREARRVRNRESAAASRQRIRDRINELETEVDEWKSKYSEALNRLAQLERCRESAASEGL